MFDFNAPLVESHTPPKNNDLFDFGADIVTSSAPTEQVVEHQPA